MRRHFDCFCYSYVSMSVLHPRYCTPICMTVCFMSSFCDILTVNCFYYFSFSDHLLIISVQIYNFPFFLIIIFYPFRSIIFIISLICLHLLIISLIVYIFQLNGLYRYQNVLFFYQINDYCFRVKGESVEETTNRFFKVDDRLILSKLKELCRRFGLEWNFVSSRNGKQTYCNRVSRKISYVSSSTRKLSSITRGCSWLVRFKDIEREICENAGQVL